MKVKVKKVLEEQSMVILSIDGVDCTYLINRPEPLTHVDARLLQYTMDSSFLRIMSESVYTTNWFTSLCRLFTFWRVPTNVLMMREDGQVVNMTEGKAHSYFGSKVVAFIQSVGIPLDVEGQECLVLTKSDLEKIEKGHLK